MEYQITISTQQTITAVKSLESTVQHAANDIKNSLVGGVQNWFKEVGFAINGAQLESNAGCQSRNPDTLVWF